MAQRAPKRLKETAYPAFPLGYPLEPRLRHFFNKRARENAESQSICPVAQSDFRIFDRDPWMKTAQCDEVGDPVEEALPTPDTVGARAP